MIYLWLKVWTWEEWKQVLKRAGPKDQGGIAGVDVKALVNSIELKQISKSIKNNRVIQAIQLCLITNMNSINSAASKIISLN